jgi:hypothetical protein
LRFAVFFAGADFLFAVFAPRFLVAESLFTCFRTFLAADFAVAIVFLGFFAAFAPAAPPTKAPTAAPTGPINDPAAAPAAAPPIMPKPCFAFVPRAVEFLEVAIAYYSIRGNDPTR